jgi:hypothetical protein
MAIDGAGNRNVSRNSKLGSDLCICKISTKYDSIDQISVFAQFVLNMTQLLNFIFRYLFGQGSYSYAHLRLHIDYLL